jgi:hypothetical protein
VTDNFAATGFGFPATASEIRETNRAHLPEPPEPTPPAEIGSTTGVNPEEVLTEIDELTQLRRRVAYLEEQNYGQATEIDMYRRFFGSKDEEDQRLFMQATIFLAHTALEFKFEQDKIEQFLGEGGVCMHPEESIRDTGFGVFICDACKKAVEPVTEPPCPHDKTVEWGTVGLIQCLDCQANLPREHFTRLADETTSLADAVGVSIPKGQPTLNPGLAPRLLPSGE